VWLLQLDWSAPYTDVVRDSCCSELAATVPVPQFHLVAVAPLRKQSGRSIRWAAALVSHLQFISPDHVSDFVTSVCELRGGTAAARGAAVRGHVYALHCVAFDESAGVLRSLQPPALLFRDAPPHAHPQPTSLPPPVDARRRSCVSVCADSGAIVVAFLCPSNPTASAAVAVVATPEPQADVAAAPLPVQWSDVSLPSDSGAVDGGDGIAAGVGFGVVHSASSAVSRGVVLGPAVCGRVPLRRPSAATAAAAAAAATASMQRGDVFPGDGQGPW
jgi:hypothetical protein